MSSKNWLGKLQHVSGLGNSELPFLIALYSLRTTTIALFAQSFAVSNGHSRNFSTNDYGTRQFFQEVALHNFWRYFQSFRAIGLSQKMIGKYILIYQTLWKYFLFSFKIISTTKNKRSNDFNLGYIASRQPRLKALQGHMSGVKKNCGTVFLAGHKSFGPGTGMPTTRQQPSEDAKKRSSKSHLQDVLHNAIQDCQCHWKTILHKTAI